MMMEMTPLCWRERSKGPTCQSLRYVCVLKSSNGEWRSVYVFILLHLFNPVWICVCVGERAV